MSVYYTLQHWSTLFKAYCSFPNITLTNMVSFRLLGIKHFDIVPERVINIMLYTLLQHNLQYVAV